MSSQTGQKSLWDAVIDVVSHTPAPPYRTSLSERLEQVMRHHVEEEQQALEGYRFVMDETGDPVVRMLMEEVLADEQLVDRGYFLYLDHVEAGRRAYDGSGFHLSRSSAEPKRAAPLLGEHTFEIATDVLGLTPEEIGDLVVEQVLY